MSKRYTNPEAEQILETGPLRWARIVGVHFELATVTITNMQGSATARYATFALDLADLPTPIRVGIRQTVWIADFWLSPDAWVGIRSSPNDPLRVVIDWAATAEHFRTPCSFGGKEALDWRFLPALPHEGRTDARGSPRLIPKLLLGMLLLFTVAPSLIYAGVHFAQASLRWTMLPLGVVSALVGIALLILVFVRSRLRRTEMMQADAPRVDAVVIALERDFGADDLGAMMNITLEAPFANEQRRQFTVEQSVPLLIARSVVPGTSLPLALVHDSPEESVIDWPAFARRLVAQRARPS